MQKSDCAEINSTTAYYFFRVEANDGPDVICHKLGLCTTETGHQCTLFPLKSGVKLQHYSQDPVLVQRAKHLRMVGACCGHRWGETSALQPGSRTGSESQTSQNSRCLLWS